jgi:hypothetical protein
VPWKHGPDGTPTAPTRTMTRAEAVALGGLHIKDLINEGRKYCSHTAQLIWNWPNASVCRSPVCHPLADQFSVGCLSM